MNAPFARPPFHLNPGQIRARELLAAGQRNTMLVGGSRSGKTFLIIRAIVVRALRAPGSRHLLTRYRFNATRGSLWLDTFPKVLHTCFPGLRAKDKLSDNFSVLPNESEMWFGGLDEKARTEKILGLEFATTFFNESSQIPYSSYQIARTRLAQVCQCTDGSVLPQREYVDLNPGGSGHWTYRLFVQKVDPTDRRPIADPDEYAYALLNPLENEENLSPKYIEFLQNLPDRQRKRFFEGVYVPEVEGALWTFDVLATSRIDTKITNLNGVGVKALQDRGVLPQMSRVVVAIDPSGTHGEEDKRSDEVGIIVAGRGYDGKAYVLSDKSCRLPPEGWGRVALNAYHDFKADRIVMEKNFGGAMCEYVIKSIDPFVPVVEVDASRGKKAVRAEPVSALYAQDRVRHVGVFPTLEDQCLNCAASGYLGDRSPDRMDALVWAITDLMLTEAPAMVISDQLLDALRSSPRPRW